MDLIERWERMQAAKSLKRGKSEEKAKDREHIQRISGIRESDLRRMSRKPGDRQATEAQERRQKQRRRTQGKNDSGAMRETEGGVGSKARKCKRMIIENQIRETNR